MNHSVDIGWENLLAAYLLLVPALAVATCYRLGVVKSTLFAVARMTVQLVLVGIYLQYLFIWNLWWVNLLWILVMIAAAGWTALRQTELSLKRYFPTVFLALATGFLAVLFYFVPLVAHQSPECSRIFIPVAGMLLGNSMRSNVIVLGRFTSLLKEHVEEFQFRQMLGATVPEALLPFVTQALKAGVAPQIATMATLGIVSLPGMMTGQMLGGSTPMVAIGYQIAIMLGIFAVQMLSSALLLTLVRRKAIDAAGNPV